MNASEFKSSFVDLTGSGRTDGQNNCAQDLPASAVNEYLGMFM